MIMNKLNMRRTLLRWNKVSQQLSIVVRDNVYNRPYRLFTFDPMASFPYLPVLARQACAWRLHLMFPARICFFLILSPITNLSLNILCTKHEDWYHTKTRLLGQKWINGKVYWTQLQLSCVKNSNKQVNNSSRAIQQLKKTRWFRSNSQAWLHSPVYMFVSSN